MIRKRLQDVLNRWRADQLTKPDDLDRTIMIEEIDRELARPDCFDEEDEEGCQKLLSAGGCLACGEKCEGDLCKMCEELSTLHARA